MCPLSILDLVPVPLGGTPADALHHSLALARTAERMGYTRYWVAEHHNMTGIASAATSVVIGYLAVQTGSILPGMVFHAVHNGAAILLTSWVADTVVTDKHWHWVAEPHPAGFVGIGYHPLIVAGGIVVAGTLLRWFSRQPHSLTYEEELQATIRERAEQLPT